MGILIHNRKKSNDKFIAIGIIAIIAIAVAFIAISKANTISQTLNCTVPPVGNPNTCHIYTWHNFPTTELNFANTGLFNNDTSYNFLLNSTNIVAYDLCVNAVGSTDNVDSTLLPQVFESVSNEWQDLHGSMLVLGNGGVSLDFGPACSGYSSVNSTLSHILPNSENNFRIAGEQNHAVGGGLAGNPQFSTLSLQLFFNRTVTPTANTQASITCITGTVATNGFTARCSLGAGTATANTVVTMNWQANLLGASFQSGSGSCTINAGLNTCTKAFPFSPTFVTPPSVILDWNPGITNVNLPVPSIIQTSTIINILT